MKIFRVDLQKAKDNIKNKIEGYPRVEREDIAVFILLTAGSETFQHLCGFQETRWENGQNIFTWTTPCLQRIITEIRRGFT